ncbi:MAG: mechanosensitive ion channel [Bacteroidales bacterium]
MKILIVIISGAMVLAILLTIRFFITKISHKFLYWRKVIKLYPVIEITIWTIFVFWATGLLFQDQIYYPYIVVSLVLVVLSLITWFFFRDIFAGAIFKFQNDLNKGDYIKIGNISGQIKSVRLTHLEIISDNGQTIKIPNTKLSQDLISGMSTPEGMEEFKFRFEFDKRFSKMEIEEKIKFEVSNSPWCNYRNPPVIKLQNEDEHSYSYDVVIYTLNDKHLSLVEKTLKEKFENWKR